MLPRLNQVAPKTRRRLWTAAAVCFLLLAVLMFAKRTREHIAAEEPLKKLTAEPGKADDTFQGALFAALKTLGGDDPTIAANVSNLVAIQKNAPEILKRYLATNPGWRLFQEQGKIFATRRWMIGSEWQYTHYGYYGNHTFDYRSEGKVPEFQARFTIGLSGKPLIDPRKETTSLRAGDSKKVSLTKVNELHESHCVISAENVSVEVFEQSLAKERRLTKAALAHLDKELAPLVAQPTWETIRAVLPPNSIRRGKASFQLRNISHGGLYNAIIWANPGEPGMLYLKAFTAFWGSPLAARSLKTSTNEWIGWSDDPAELFFSDTHFMIYDGGWGSAYPARFEVWFVPDSGAPERKLMARVFKVHDFDP
jgi:hypothetical protein